MKKTDFDIRYEKVEADGSGELRGELWRRFWDDLLTPDADEIAEQDSALQDNFQKSKMISVGRTSPPDWMLQYKYC